MTGHIFVFQVEKQAVTGAIKLVGAFATQLLRRYRDMGVLSMVEYRNEIRRIAGVLERTLAGNAGTDDQAELAVFALALEGHPGVIGNPAHGVLKLFAASVEV